MEYANFYLQAADISDSISKGEFRETVGLKRKGLINNRTKSTSEEETQSSFEQKILDYFQTIDNLPSPQVVVAPPETSPRPPVNPRVNTYAPIKYEGPMADQLMKAKKALATIESGHKYDAVGPVVEKGQYKGQRAYGKYQVMEGNIGPWTKEAMGKELSVAEFVANPDAQEAVVELQLMRSKKKYGTWEDAASVWFSGRPVSKAGNASDGYTTVPEYVSKFQNYMKG